MTSKYEIQIGSITNSAFVIGTGHVTIDAKTEETTLIVSADDQDDDTPQTPAT